MKIIVCFMWSILISTQSFAESKGSTFSEYMRKYGESLLIQAQYETKPFRFFQTTPQGPIDAERLFSQFYTVEGNALLLARESSKEETISDVFLSGFERANTQGQMEKSPITPTFVTETLAKLEAMDDVITGVWTYESLSHQEHGGLKPTLDDQAYISRFLVDQHQTNTLMGSAAG